MRPSVVSFLWLCAVGLWWTGCKGVHGLEVVPGDGKQAVDTGAPGDGGGSGSGPNDADGDGFSASEDCDDGNSDIHPGAAELCNGVDDDCDEVVDEDAVDAAVWFADADADGYGASEGVHSCTAPPGTVQVPGDCDDTDGAVHPGASELCNQVDDDCDDAIDEDAVDASTWYGDADHDGYGDAAVSSEACTAPEWTVANATDCDDAQPTVYPGAPARCDNLDNNCDGVVDDGWRVPSDFPTIQAALDATTGGETICVEAGTYTERLQLPGLPLTLEGSEGPEHTTISGGGAGPVVTIHRGESQSTTIRGFTIADGDATLGAGLYIRGAGPALADLIIEGHTCNTDECMGTALYASGDTGLTLTDVLVQDNTQSGRTIWTAGVYLHDSNASLERVRILHNDGVATYAIYGGGLTVAGDSNVDLQNVELLANTIDGLSIALGAGLYVYDGALVTASGLVVAGNVGTSASGVLGAGISNNNDTTLILDHSTIVRNDNISGSTAQGSGLLTMQSAVLDMSHSIVASNTFSGAAISGYLGGVAVEPGCDAVLEYNDVWFNGYADYAGISDPTGFDGNLAVDPQFVSFTGVDPLVWDLRPASGSPVVDAGDPSCADPDGSNCDMGAWSGASAAGWVWDATIEAVRLGDIPVGHTVTLEGVVVTSVGAGHFTVQDPAASTPAYSGITIETVPLGVLARGMELRLVGQVVDANGESRLVVQPEDLSITGVVSEPSPVVLALADALDEAWEGVLVEVSGGTLDDAAYDCSADDPACTDADLWTLTDGSSTPLIIDPSRYEGSDWSDHIESGVVTGVMAWRWSRRRLLPRTHRDF